jgi:dienelactone hydrolase
MPADTSKPVPLVITSLGPGGFAAGREALYADAFTAAGIAMMAIDSFGARGFSETRSDQGRFSTATACADAVYAFEHMRADTRFAADRIALFGYSRGGSAVMMTNNDRLQGAILGTDARFAAYVALYPSVWLRWTHPRPTGGPVLAVLAERDDMAPLDRQRERMAELTAAGADLETLLIPLVGHSFDAVYPASFRNGANFCNWDIAVDDDGSMKETKSGVRDEGDWSEFLQAIRAGRDTTSGGTTGYGGAARSVAVAPVLAFLTRTLLRG